MNIKPNGQKIIRASAQMYIQNNCVDSARMKPLDSFGNLLLCANGQACICPFAPSFFRPWCFMIISFASSKGGVGKSTACAAIGARLAQRGEEVVILDLDQNRTVDRWGRKRKITGLTIKAIERDSFTTIFRELREAGATNSPDHILIDLAGAREATVLKAIARSDLVVIPAQASEPDLREALVVVSDIKDVGEEMPAPIPYRVLLTKAIRSIAGTSDAATGQFPTASSIKAAAPSTMPRSSRRTSPKPTDNPRPRVSTPTN